MRGSVKYIFMLYKLDIERIKTLALIHAQTLPSLTLTTNYIQAHFRTKEYR
jgi:hypothetical protein